MKIKRTEGYKPALFAFTLFACAWAILLLYAGAYTTSIQAGMAFLDWPLSNSSINPEGWLTEEDKLAEHSHRLLGMKLGLISMTLVGWTFFREANRRIRRLAWILLGMVIFQGLLGGMRVLFDQLNIGTESNFIAQTFAVLHACGAEITVCLLVALTTICSRPWIERQAGLSSPVSASMRTWGLAAVVGIFLQILIGAVMRHTGAGLAIQTFPLASEGSLLPQSWPFAITIHWLHRLGAVFVTALLLVFTCKVFGQKQTRQAWGWLATLVLALLAIQIFLGAATIWTQKNPVMASTHMLVGAILLATTWMLTLLTFRLPIQSFSFTTKTAASQTQASSSGPIKLQA